ncbi:hypothetical protein AB6N23_07510 [Cellulomonas sp. 179-A 9B4 NHS]|uniref:hypothetical protein n=1 Tax=Cellulomonas sp. 179-A 9B4 NHS TaxID=3142379 RepID=UPI0039A091FB
MTRDSCGGGNRRTDRGLTPHDPALAQHHDTRQLHNRRIGSAPARDPAVAQHLGGRRLHNDRFESSTSTTRP